jgi:hypothetical protein
LVIGASLEFEDWDLGFLPQRGGWHSQGYKGRLAYNFATNERRDGLNILNAVCVESLPSKRDKVIIQVVRRIDPKLNE